MNGKSKFNIQYDTYTTGTLYDSERDGVPFPEKEEKTESATVKGVVCNAINVNVRTQPRKDSKVVCVLRSGTEVEILGKMPNFYKISVMDFPGRELYISSKYCKEV